MMLFSLEEQLDARGSDVLEFLEREVRYIHPVTGPLGHKQGLEYRTDFHGERSGNIISVYLKAKRSAGKGCEVIRFHIIQSTSRTCRVKAFYQTNDDQSKYLFHRIWAKLAIAFGARFAAQALGQLRALRHRSG